MNHLSEAMRRTASSPDDLADIARKADVSVRQAAVARAGKPINSGAYLALCGAAGVDPLSGLPRPTKTVSSNVEWWLLSHALHITRGLKGLNQRKAAKLIGISTSTVCRAETGKPVSIVAMIRICNFIGVHPDGYTSPLNCRRRPVSRETPTETRCSDLSIDRGHAAPAMRPS